MRIRRLALTAFRNLAPARLEFDQPRTVILGSNGQGKTNLLEAVHLLCVTRSFRRARNEQFVRTGERAFQVEAEFDSDLRGRRLASVSGGRGGLSFELDREKVRGLGSYFGQLPVVVLSPEQAVVTHGGPDQRRRYLDRLISAQSPLYLEALFRYQRALRQRNALLARGEAKDPQCDVWEAELARSGLDLLERRRAFIDDWLAEFKEVYSKALSQDLPVDMKYRCTLGTGALPPEEQVRETLRERRQRDALRGGTSIGPHRDQLEFSLDGLPLRDFGSQGQHKLFLLALILVESRMLQARTGEVPLLLLDDLFGVLDDERIRLIGESVDRESQLLVTTTSERHLEVLGRDNTQVLHMEGGVIRHG